MKRIFTLLAAMMMGSMAFAQVDETFVFTDLQGNVVADGTTIVVNTLDEMGQMVVPLKVRNTTSEKHFGAVYESIDAKPNGDWQTCVFGQCMILKESGFSNKAIADGGAEQDLETEWIPEEEAYATWEATLQLRVFETKQGMFGPQAGAEIAQGATVKVRFEYNDPTGVKAIRNSLTTTSKYYDLQGRTVAQPTRGLYIVDGKKVIIK